MLNAINSINEQVMPENNIAFSWINFWFEAFMTVWYSCYTPVMMTGSA
jgi:hypothetical protein